VTQPHFTIAALKPEELEEVRIMERKLSERNGHAISLIAYEASDANQNPNS